MEIVSSTHIDLTWRCIVNLRVFNPVISSIVVLTELHERLRKVSPAKVVVVADVEDEVACRTRCRNFSGICILTTSEL